MGTTHYHRRHHPHSDKSTTVSENETTLAAGLTPSRGSESADQFLPGNRSAILDLQRADEVRPSNCSSEANPTGDSTPSEVRFLIQLDALQCSPIRGIPEEEGDGGCSRSQLLDHASSSKQSSRLYGLSQSQKSGMSSDSASRASTRPLPDINAFEGDGVANSRDRSSDGSAAASSSVSQSTSPKLLCLPTPIRTPAWAHHEPEIVARQGQPESFGRSNHPPKLGRSNSLIMTKVLATCSPWFLEGRDNPACGENEAVDPDFLPIRSSHSQYPAPFHSTELASASRKASISMATSFDVLSVLGSGTFADVYKVRSKADGRLYAVKRNRRRFRGKRDREAALSEVQCMQQLQSKCSTSCIADSNVKYLLSFFIKLGRRTAISFVKRSSAPVTPVANSWTRFGPIGMSPKSGTHASPLCLLHLQQ